MKPISESEARKLGLQPVTEADRAAAVVETSSGKVTYKAWCEHESERLQAAGRTPRIVTEQNDRIALWALPPPVVVKAVTGLQEEKKT